MIQLDGFIQIIRLSDRNDGTPAGSWVSGSSARVTLDEARDLIASGRAQLAPGETMPAVMAGGAFETASMDGGATPSAEAPRRAASRKRGRA